MRCPVLSSVRPGGSEPDRRRSSPDRPAARGPLRFPTPVGRPAHVDTWPMRRAGMWGARPRAKPMCALSDLCPGRAGEEIPPSLHEGRRRISGAPFQPWCAASFCRVFGGFSCCSRVFRGLARGAFSAPVLASSRSPRSQRLSVESLARLGKFHLAPKDPTTRAVFHLVVQPLAMSSIATLIADVLFPIARTGRVSPGHAQLFTPFSRLSMHFEWQELRGSAPVLLADILRLPSR